MVLCMETNHHSNNGPQETMSTTVEIRTLSFPTLTASRVDRFAVPSDIPASALTVSRLVRGVEHNYGGLLFEVSVGSRAPERGYLVNGRFSVIPRDEA